MKKILLLLLFVVISGVTLSQSLPNQTNNTEVVMLTKEKHDALRKDIEDYKNLLIKYQSLKIEYEIVMVDMERQSKASEHSLSELKKANHRVEAMEAELEALYIKISKLQDNYASLDRSYKQTARLYYIEKGKVNRMRKGQANVYVWKITAVFCFISVFIVAGNN